MDHRPYSIGKQKVGSSFLITSFDFVVLMDSITTKVFISLNFVEQYFASGGEPVGTPVPIMSVTYMQCLDMCIDMVILPTIFSIEFLHYIFLGTSLFYEFQNSTYVLTCILTILLPMTTLAFTHTHTCASMHMDIILLVISTYHFIVKLEFNINSLPP